MARGRSRGFARQQRRKFVWHREVGAWTNPGGTGPFGTDLLTGFRNIPGATHLGATVMRVRGYIYPQVIDGAPTMAAVAGLRVDTWDQVLTANDVSPLQGSDEDWMGWFPYLIFGTAGASSVTGNAQADPFAVDVKANRKLEELQETLYLFGSSTPGDVTWHYSLSIGLKLP